MKKFVSFTFILIFSFSHFKLGADSKELPPRTVRQAAKTLFQVESIYNDSKPNGGTGFVVQSKDGRKFVVTTRHIVQEDKSFGSLSDEKSLEIEFAQVIELTHWRTGKKFRLCLPNLLRGFLITPQILQNHPQFHHSQIMNRKFFVSSGNPS